MKKILTTILLGLSVLAAPSAFAMQGHGSAASDHGSAGHTDMTRSDGGTFVHEAVSEGIRAEFQVMSLASMNMKDPEGNTHHIMVKVFPEGSDQQIEQVVGKVKVIGPS